MAYTWLAIHQDGSVFAQRDPKTGKEHSIKHVDRKQLAAFAILDGDGRIVVRQHFEPGQRLIYRKRTRKTCNARSADEREVVCHMIGWQKTVGGENVQHISYVFENGWVESAGQFRDNHPWFYGVEPVAGDNAEVGSNAVVPVTDAWDNWINRA